MNCPKMSRVRTQNYRQRGVSTEEDVFLQMLLDLDRIPWYHNIGAVLFSWVLLAGYVVVPGTFTSLQRSKAVEEHLHGSDPQCALLNIVQNPLLLVISSILFIIGLPSLLWLGYTW